MIDLKELREIIQAAKSKPTHYEAGFSTKASDEYEKFLRKIQIGFVEELLNRLEAAESKLKKRDLGKAFWHTRYKQKCEADLEEFKKLQHRLEAAENESKQWQESYNKLNTQGERLLAKIDDECCKMHERLKAAEKVCDAVKMFSLQVPYQSNKNGIAMWGEIDNALKQWQEVN